MKLGTLYLEENRDRKTNEKGLYWVGKVVLDTGGIPQEVEVAFTQKELRKAVNRAVRNPEDFKNTDNISNIIKKLLGIK